MGKKVVDLWGGWRDYKKREPWSEDTLILVYSTTKGISGLAMALGHSRGYFDYDAPVANYWPEFAQNGKESITIRDLMSHQAGLCRIEEPIDFAILSDQEALAKILARQKPLWMPREKHGYHALTLGFYENELMRRTDPHRRTIGQFFRDEIAKPLGLEFYIGLPDEVSDARLARIHAPLYKVRMVLNMDKLPKRLVKAFIDPRSITYQSFTNPKVLGEITKYNDREMLRIELPAANGVGQVRSIAKLYGVFATGGAELKIRPETMAALVTPAQTPRQGPHDEVLLSDSSFSAGFMKPFPDFPFGTNAKAFGAAGVGGSFAYADPDTGVGFAYAMNRPDYWAFADPRHDALSRALFETLNKMDRAHVMAT